MYPYDLFFGLDLYDILFIVGFCSALFYFRFWADRRHFSARHQNICILSALAAVIGGYGSAVLFQAFYNYLESGVFEIVGNTGATFYGGLIGGAALFLLIYFVVGCRVLHDRAFTERFFEVSEIAAGSIALAHGFGRLGCLFAGCCHGKITEAWYGIYHVGLEAKVVPVQLFEAVFLLALASYLTWRLYRGLHGSLGLYLVTYAVWRFAIEFLRADARGQSPIPFLSPSQLTAILLAMLGCAVWLIECIRKNPKIKNGGHPDVT